MNYRPLGRTGVKVSPLCLGTMNFGPRTPEDEAIQMMHRAIDDGINFIDTANFYGQPLKDGKGQGESEKIVGKAIKQSGKRHRLILATKVHAPTAAYPDDPNAAGNSRRHIMMEVENSLRRLQTDYIDLYQMHSPQASVPIDETLRALDDLVRQGKVRYIGTSNFAAWQIVESLWTSKEYGLNRFVTEQMEYSILKRGAEKALIPMAEKYDIGLLPWSPLAGGILTGKYRQQEKTPDGSRQTFSDWANWAKGMQRPYQDAVLDLLATMAAEKEATISQVALAWTLRQEAVAATIIGPRTMAQYEDNFGAMAIEFTDEDNGRLDAVAPL
ncbi:MAG: aldo/keto reductase [Chloroflexi bacterium]|nr:aldo/keto reductase [Chloroflexota bacterium]